MYEQHLHDHLRGIEDRLDGIETALQSLARLEIITSVQEMSAMANQAEEINKLADKVDGLGAVVTDVHSDFEALRAAMEADRESLTATGLAALDAANAKADGLRQKLQDLDVAVGDADSSDIPTDGGGGEEPAGGVAPEDFGGARPTA